MYDIEDDLPGVDTVHGKDRTQRRIIQSAMKSDNPEKELDMLGISVEDARSRLGLENDPVGRPGEFSEPLAGEEYQDAIDDVTDPKSGNPHGKKKRDDRY